MINNKKQENNLTPSTNFGPTLTCREVRSAGGRKTEMGKRVERERPKSIQIESNRKKKLLTNTEKPKSKAVNE